MNIQQNIINSQNSLEKLFQFASTLSENNQNTTTMKQTGRTKNAKATKATTQLKPSSTVCLYHIDCIYLGGVNSSHYRQGLGIVQSLSFHNFLGNFKNGRAQGLGLIILNSGTRIYGNFTKDELTGLGLIDNGKHIKLGLWSKFQLNGIGYEYDGQSYLWRMVKFYKSSVVQVIKEQACNLQQGKVPSLMNLQHSLYILLQNYLDNQYFGLSQKEEEEVANQKECLEVALSERQNNYASMKKGNSKFVHFQGQRIIYFGLLQGQKQQGLGVKFDISDKSVTETGFYQDGKLQGYGFKNNNTIKYKQIGMFVEGKKQGLFIHDDGKQQTYCLYRDDTYLQPWDINNGLQVLRKKQKQYNYNKKAFLSQKNTLDLNQYEALVGRTFLQTDLIIKQSVVHINENDGNDEARKESSRKDLDRILGSKVKKEVTKSRLRENEIKISQKSAMSSLSVLKQKFRYFQILDPGNHQNHVDNMHRVQVNKGAQSNENYSQRVSWKDQNQYLMRENTRRRTIQEEDNDEIAQQENPFAFGVLQSEYHRNMIKTPTKVEKHWL